MGNLVARKTNIIHRKEIGSDFLRPEEILLQLDKRVKSRPLDVGCIAYKEVSKKQKCHRGSFYVNESSFQKERRELIQVILDSFMYDIKDSTVFQLFSYYEACIRHCDESGLEDFFLSPIAARKAYQSLTNFLNERLSLGELKPVSAGNYQRAFRHLIGLFFPSDRLSIIRSAVPIRNSTHGSTPPSSTSVVHYVKTAYSLARQLDDVLTQGKPYPFAVTIDDIEIVHFPSNSGVLSPYTSRQDLVCWSKERMELVSTEEYLAKARQLGRMPKRHTVEKDLEKARQSLDNANVDLRGYWRMRHASLALQSYTYVLMLVMGATASEMAEFDFLDALDIEKSTVKKELSSIKFRANGRKTKYALSKRKGLQILHQYLEFRSWYLGSSSFPKLFFSVNKDPDIELGLATLNKDFVTKFHKRISGVYLARDCPVVSSRASRKFKSTALYSLGFSPVVVADVLNHTVSTNLGRYANGNIDQQASQLVDYWSSVRHAAARALSADVVAFSTSTGHCRSFNSPMPESESTPIKPNCKIQLGCLYCENYLIHAEAEDIQKLLSLKYVVEAVRGVADDVAHAEHLFKDLVIRINALVDKIASLSPRSNSLVSTVERNVFELGMLTPFWERWMQRYEHMGVEF